MVKELTPEQAAARRSVDEQLRSLITASSSHPIEVFTEEVKSAAIETLVGAGYTPSAARRLVDLRAGAAINQLNRERIRERKSERRRGGLVSIDARPAARHTRQGSTFVSRHRG